MKKGFKKVLGMAACLLMFFAVGCSSDGDSSGKETGNNNTGSAGIYITVDGTIKCDFCEKEYQKKADVLACEHYKCSVCGTAYKTEEGPLSCVDHITVKFIDSTGVNSDVTQTVKSGSKVNVPDWNGDGFELSWESDNASYSDPAAVLECEGAVSVTFTAKYTTVYICDFCGQKYYSREESDSCGHYICQNENCEKHISGYATALEAENCGLKNGCPHYSVTCECGAVYSSDADKNACVHYTVSFTDPDGLNTASIQILKAGTRPVVPKWIKENYTLSWSSEVTDAAADVTYTAVWTELPKCSNCGEHYATEAAAGNCARIDGCPQFGKDNDWVAGDAALPSWLSGISGSATSDNKKVPYASKNYTRYVKIAKNTTITVTPGKTGNITLYIAANKDSTDVSKTASAVCNGVSAGSSYNLPAYNTTPSPYVVAVSEEMVGKPVLFKTSYETLWFAITLNE